MRNNEIVTLLGQYQRFFPIKNVTKQRHFAI